MKRSPRCSRGSNEADKALQLVDGSASPRRLPCFNRALADSKFMKVISFAKWMLAAGFLFNIAVAADRTFSGPQIGETTTPFKVVGLAGTNEAKQRDPVTENAGGAAAFVFVHTLERSLVPLLRVVDEYGARRQDRLTTEIIFLVSDRLEGEQRSKAATRSLGLKSRAGLSLDGPEGPGNYGLNKECMMTIITAKDNKVTANFAFVQPGIADAPAVLAALARTCGDSSPPTLDELTTNARGGDARGQQSKMKRDGAAKEEFPGAVPTDPKLNSLLRQIIRPTNDDATVDNLAAQMEKWVNENPGLKQQAIDGWTRVLYFGDRYGTAHARKTGQELLTKLKTAKQ